MNAACLCAAIYGILMYSVLGRTGSDNHQFVWYVQNHEDPIWEMGMNAFLYFPLGLTLSTIIGPWTILICFITSLTIESWQYFAGTGLAQGTDVLMNTLGCAIGTVPVILEKTGVVEKVVTFLKKTVVLINKRS